MTNKMSTLFNRLRAFFVTVGSEYPVCITITFFLIVSIIVCIIFIPKKKTSEDDAPRMALKLRMEMEKEKEQEKGKWSPWSEWNACTGDCGIGTESETRSCLAGNCSGEGEAVNVRGCKKEICPKWGSWSKFSECSKSCGVGTQSETRVCAEGNCIGESIFTENCNVQICPKWAPWQWSSCETGTESGTRVCTEGSCDGSSSESRSCSSPINGGWSNWSAKNCGLKCYGDQNLQESRTCTNPTPEFGGANCVGEASRSYTCPKDSCDLSSNINGTFVLQRPDGSCLFTYEANVIGNQSCDVTNSFFAVRILQSPSKEGSVIISDTTGLHYFQANANTTSLTLTPVKSEATNWNIFKTSDNYYMVKMNEFDLYLPSFTTNQASVQVVPTKWKLIPWNDCKN